VVNATPWPLYPQEKDPVSILFRGLGGSQGWSRWARKICLHRDSIPGPSSPWRISVLTTHISLQRFKPDTTRLRSRSAAHSSETFGQETCSISNMKSLRSDHRSEWCCPRVAAAHSTCYCVYCYCLFSQKGYMPVGITTFRNVYDTVFLFEITMKMAGKSSNYSLRNNYTAFIHREMHHLYHLMCRA
jgi:hypothetical protein